MRARERSRYQKRRSKLRVVFEEAFGKVNVILELVGFSPLISMSQRLGYVALVVRDYDEAIAFYREKLGFELLEDTDLGGGKRWVLVAPRNSVGTALLLARAVTPEQAASIGNQTGGRVFLFLHTDDFWRDYHGMIDRG